MSEQTKTAVRIREREIHAYWANEARKMEWEYGEGGDLPHTWSEPVNERSDFSDRAVEESHE